MDDEPIWNLTHLSLSYKNIIDIDNLQGMEKLVKLQLDNNIITKIQNLDLLVNLEWLDLSFNLIKKIEGLDTLTNLTDLSLYSNKITELSGLDKLKKLNILSFGANFITDSEKTFEYLRSLNNKLQVLKIDGNKFLKGGQPDPDVKLYAIESLKNLKYLDYEVITEEMRTQAKQKF